MSTTGPEGHRIPLSSVPAGTEAWITGPASAPLRDRRGNLKARTVDLRATSPAPADPATLPDLTDTDLTWLLSATSRTAQAWERRFGPRTVPLVHALTAAGVVHARHQLTPNLGLGPLQKTLLTGPWQTIAAQRGQDRLHHSVRLQTSAHTLASALAVHDQEPGLQAWLSRASGTEPRLQEVLAATQDLLDGVVHDGPRAFSQHHFGDTKTNDDIASVLRTVGATSDMLERLGIARAQYVGLAGPIQVLPAEPAAGPGLEVRAVRGPLLLRADQQLRLQLLPGTRAVIVVENLQAAETLAGSDPDVAVIHTNGQPGEDLLALIKPLVQQTVPVHVICDADLGGCRIAHRIVTIAPEATVHDIGQYLHTPGRAFAPTSITGLTRLLSTPVGPFAQACLDRGYVVEQESATRAAVRSLLSNRP
jgi:hypothetical protein